MSKTFLYKVELTDSEVKRLYSLYLQKNKKYIELKWTLPGFLASIPGWSSSTRDKVAVAAGIKTEAQSTAAWRTEPQRQFPCYSELTCKTMNNKEINIRFHFLPLSSVIASVRKIAKRRKKEAD